MPDARLRQLFEEHLREFHWQAIETGGTGRGIPDMNGCCEGTEVWIENKRTGHWKIEITAEQSAWAERRIRAGGRCFVAVRRQFKKEDELWLYSGNSARALLDLPTDAVPPLGRWVGGPARWPWEQVKRIILA
jgi:hypothetical protein